MRGGSLIKLGVEKTGAKVIFRVFLLCRYQTEHFLCDLSCHSSTCLMQAQAPVFLICF